MNQLFGEQCWQAIHDKRFKSKAKREALPAHAPERVQHVSDPVFMFVSAKTRILMHVKLYYRCIRSASHLAWLIYVDIYKSSLTIMNGHFSVERKFMHTLYQLACGGNA